VIREGKGFQGLGGPVEGLRKTIHEGYKEGGVRAISEKKCNQEDFFW